MMQFKTLFISYYTMVFGSSTKNIAFNKNLWLQNRENRMYMATSIINNKLIDAYTKDEVRAVLGFEFNDLYSNIWSYYLGKKRGFFSSKQYLFVYFNDAGRVFKVLKK